MLVFEIVFLMVVKCYNKVVTVVASIKENK